MCNPKKNIVSFKDKFDVVAPVTMPLRFNAPSKVTARNRQVEVAPGLDGITTIIWTAKQEGYTEEYRLCVRLDEGAKPEPDGSGVVSAGFPVEVHFYTPAN